MINITRTTLQPIVNWKPAHSSRTPAFMFSAGPFKHLVLGSMMKGNDLQPSRSYNYCYLWNLSVTGKATPAVAKIVSENSGKPLAAPEPKYSMPASPIDVGILRSALAYLNRLNGGEGSWRALLDPGQKRELSGDYYVRFGQGWVCARGTGGWLAARVPGLLDNEQGEFMQRDLTHDDCLHGITMPLRVLPMLCEVLEGAKSAHVERWEEQVFPYNQRPAFAPMCRLVIDHGDGTRAVLTAPVSGGTASSYESAFKHAQQTVAYHERKATTILWTTPELREEYLGGRRGSLDDRTMFALLHGEPVWATSSAGWDGWSARETLPGTVTGGVVWNVGAVRACRPRARYFAVSRVALRDMTAGVKGANIYIDTSGQKTVLRLVTPTRMGSVQADTRFFSADHSGIDAANIPFLGEGV